MKRFFTLFLCFTLILLTTSTNAQLTEWFFEGEVITPSNVDINITASNASRGSGIDVPSSGGFPAGCGSTDAYSSDGWTTGATPNSNDYYEFSVTPLPGRTITITGFSCALRASGNGPDDWSIRSSIDGFASDLGTGSITESSSCSGAAVAVGSSFENLSSIVTFRVYGYNATTGSGTLRIDNVAVEGNSALPVSLTSFTAKSQGTSVALKWATASEDGNDYFAVEHSSNGKEFKEIGQVVGAGWSNLDQQYHFVHEYVNPGTHYYRLRQVDFDGDYEFSPVVTVEVNSNGSVFLTYPTIVFSDVTIDIPDNTGSDATIQIFNASGQEVYNQPVGGKGTVTINVEEFEPGAYFIRFNDGNQYSTSRFFRL